MTPNTTTQSGGSLHQDAPMQPQRGATISLAYMLFGILFCVCLITSNLLETKLITIGWLNITGGLLVFPISYIINDCIAEVWGFKRARLIIWLGFAANIFVALMGLAAVQLPGSPYWDGEAHFNYVFNFAPRIVVASLSAFLIGSFLNAYVMSRMKVATQGRGFSLRAILSTLVGETADSVVFFPIAFLGVVTFAEMLQMMLIQIALKTLYEIIILPITIRVVRYVKRIEGIDTYDTNISYNVLKVKEL